MAALPPLPLSYIEAGWRQSHIFAPSIPIPAYHPLGA